MRKKKKRCANIREEEELGNDKLEKIIKQQYCSSIITMHENKSAASSSWSDLGVDLLIEINKKLCNYADHIRFRGVCRSWRAVGHDEKRAADVLPWLMSLCVDSRNELSYKLYEPHSLITTSTTTTISHTINYDDYFDHISKGDILTPEYIRYVDGWLHISLYNFKSKSFSFLFFSLATKASFRTLPQLNHSKPFLFLALSTTPVSPDCVFVALSLKDYFTRTIYIFRHGDTHWTTTEFVGGWFGRSQDMATVFICGVFYFLNTAGIVSYDLATGELKLDRYSTMLESNEIHSFFGLDGDLLLASKERLTWKLCIRKYDWSKKVWVPLQSLGGRSLYLGTRSVYVDEINYYGISFANKIYVRVSNEPYVDEYTLENGQLSKCHSATLRSWGHPCSYTPFSIWVCPPDVLLRT